MFYRFIEFKRKKLESAKKKKKKLLLLQRYHIFIESISPIERFRDNRFFDKTANQRQNYFHA